MSAADHLHPRQLAMFMPAHVLANPRLTRMYHVDYEGMPYEDVKETKLSEAKTGPAENAWEFSREAITNKTTLRDSIAAEGVKTPVKLHHEYGSNKPELGEGHHRVFTANDLNPNMEIPVKHYRYDESGMSKY